MMSVGSKWRTLLLLGRVSNLPTVFSNCLAGWLLGGNGFQGGRFLLLLCGATLLYTGGMFLNDAFDAEFDSQHRRDRPIPRGAIAENTVWQIGFGLLAGGLVFLLPLGFQSALLALCLAASIVLYDAIHKMVAFSPMLMALCRLFLYLLAASAASRGLTGLATWGSIAIACYIVGLSYLARKEATGIVVEKWPQLLLAVPLLLALLVNDGFSRNSALAIGVVFIIWTVRCLRSVWLEPRNIPRTVSGLLAGIVWVDLLAVADESAGTVFAFVILFLLALAFQRFVPAT
jgi:heme O synthase-like polyprenyltransferase